MDDFANILERDYGLKPQGKPAPMSSSSSTSVKPASFSSALGNGTNRRSPAPVLSNDDPFFGTNDARSSSSGKHSSLSGSDLLGGGNDDVFGGPPKFASFHAPAASSTTYNFEDIFTPASQKQPSPPATSNKASSYPVFDTPVYDDDIFGGLPGIKSGDSAVEDVFNVGSTSGRATTSASYDDLLGGFGSNEAKDTNTNTDAKPSYDLPLAADSAFDDLLPGFGTSKPPQPAGEQKDIPQRDGSAVNLMEDPFSVFESESTTHSDPAASSSANPDVFEAPAENFGRKDEVNGAGPNDNFSRTDFVVPEFTKSSAAATEINSTRKSADILSPSPIQARESIDSSTQVEERVAKERKITPPNRVKSEESMSTSSAGSVSGSSSCRNKPTKSTSADNQSESRQAFWEPAASPSYGRGEAAKVWKSVSVNEFWLSVEDVRLVTQPTEAPPPMRPPPAPGSKQGHSQRSSPTQNLEANIESYNGVRMPSEPLKEDRIEEPDAVLDGLEEFASGSFRMKSQNVDRASFPFEEEQGSAAAAASGAAMKEAIERAEAKLREAKEAKFRDKEEAHGGVRGKEVRGAREKEEEKEAKARRDKERDREARDARHREREKEERRRQKEREREEKERANERERELEKEKEREREREKDRADEIARQRAAVERATAEVREREAQKAVERAAEAKAKADRAAVERATAEARQRHERIAMERARAAEREKTERERAAAQEKAERERTTATTTAAARGQQQSNGDDLESFFMSTARPTSAPKQRTQDTSTFPAAQQSSEGLRRSTGAVSNVKKVPSMPSMVDDLTSIFGGVPLNPGDFQEIEGEPADRRKARWERHQRTLERAAKALEEKHQRDLQSARDQDERHRAGQIVDAEIKRWAAGKEGNLRALLSTLQYVLWPECGWQAVSLTDVITAAAVKKVYRKATLCVHPDKVQQKGATNQQKYIAEKVFDLLKEAWNKFNSEELF